jgi:hypothetical protein
LDPAVIYALDQNDRLVHCNQAWDCFAIENNGDRATREFQLGLCIFDAIPVSLKAFYRDLYTRVRATRQEQTHVMECSSPLLQRRFHMSIRPFGESGVLTVNSLVDETPHSEDSHESESVYIDQNGIITCCSHCRRTQNSRQKERWDWIPEFLANDRRISHGLCPVCFNYHYGMTIP